MIIHRLDAAPSAELGRALEVFERAFSYPLGPGRSFRICHGEDYHRFFRAMGEAACFVAEGDGAVLGTVAVVIRSLGLPDGSERPIAYVADLKVAEAARGGPALLSLARAAEAWAGGRALGAFGIVMEGTRVSPGGYGGRVRIPSFQELARLAVLRFSTDGAGQVAASGRGVDVGADGAACARELSRGRYWTADGAPGERSRMTPVWLVTREGLACGRLEDTRRAKRLLVDDDSELVSAHLSRFAFRTPAAGASVIAAALGRAAELGYPGLFVAVAERDAEGLCRALSGVPVTVAPALVYGAGLETGVGWNVNSAEI